MAGVWSTCPLCGSVVANKDLHDAWHTPGPDEPVNPGEEPTDG